MVDFHSLKVGSIEKLTPNSVSLTFEIPKELKPAFSFTAGQYITLKHQMNNRELRRAYSISSAPSSGQLTVGIKKMPNGTFSVFANEKLREGDFLEVMPPDGRFVFKENGAPKNIAAFAVGSGITPIMSIAQTALERGPKNTFVLVFGNQTPRETMYLKTLKELQKKHIDRFFIQFVYSRTKEDNALFGRIGPSTVNLIVKNKFKDTSFDAFYLCGPENMINIVSDTLKNNGVMEDRILFELFTSSSVEDKLAGELKGKTHVEVIMDNEDFSFTMGQNELVLDVALKENIAAPYSCHGGVCGSCIARIKEGRAEMVKNQILTDGEVTEGLVLTCQAHPLTPTLKVDYDDV